MAEPVFWNDRKTAEGIIGRLNELKQWVEPWKRLEKALEDIEILGQLSVEEEDAETKAEVLRELDRVEHELKELEFRNMLSGEDDRKNAILTIHPGAGGTESADWAQMLLRMYLRWIERRGFRSEMLDLQPGDEAGVKSATLEVTGKYAYGYLKAEIGVHRLVRISPFDAQHRRHTSFASVFVYPEVEEDIEVDIQEEDLRIDTFRASGAGGQHVNKTESAVRITHIPTGIVVQCQNERSQHKNRASAMKVLRARLYQYYKEEEQKKLDALENEKKRIEWGSQIRSYVFHPYNMVKDHRTEVETSNVEAVMDGDIDQFIHAYLSQNGRPGSSLAPSVLKA